MVFPSMISTSSAQVDGQSCGHADAPIRTAAPAFRTDWFMARWPHIRFKSNHFSLVMVGLVPAIYVLLKRCKKDVDARDKRGHDGRAVIGSHQNPLLVDGTGFDSAPPFAWTRYSPMRTTKIAPNIPQASPIGSSSNSNISRPTLPIHE